MNRADRDIQAASREDSGPSRKSFAQRLVVFSEAIKLSHSIFALPFALSAVFLAAQGWPHWLVLVQVVIACVAARTAAMAFNRLVDAEIDARNPRTSGRAVPSGQLSKTFFAGAVVVSSAAFVATAAWINSLALALSPVALIVLLGYSLTKRFTSLSHLVLGIALGLSPVGAWIAVRGELALVPVLLGLAVLFWTAGFDMIYACQDRDFDVDAQLHSIPAALGIRGALLLARAFHVLAASLLIALGVVGGYGVWYAVGVIAVVGLLVYEHSIVRADDLSRVDVAFFTLNGLVSLVFMAAVLAQTLS